MSGDSGDIVDRINELVDEQLAQERSGYDHNINQERCHLCRAPWHGLERPDTGCPGAFADQSQTAAWEVKSPVVALQQLGAAASDVIPIFDSLICAIGQMFGLTEAATLTEFATCLLEMTSEIEAEIEMMPETEQSEARDLLAAIRSYAAGGENV